jgi:homoserine acetyltransferase
VLVIASTARTMPAQNIAFQEVGRQAIMADPKWQGGDYLRHRQGPDAGLSVARMAAHITYLSEASLTEKFGRRLQDRAEKTFGFDADFQVESYLRHQGLSLHRPVRCQFVPLYHPRDETISTWPRSMAAAGRCLRRQPSAVLRGQL